MHCALTFYTKKQLQQTLSATTDASSAGTTGGRYRCVPPHQLPFGAGGAPQPLLRADAIEALRRDRVVCVDGAVPPEAAAQAAQEVRVLASLGLLRPDPDDPCNPLQQRYDLQLWHAGMLDQLASIAPGLVRCVRALWSLPAQLQEELGLALRVPQTMMVARYPPGAYYRRHMDSYDGHDIPRLVTVLLYLVWQPQAGGQLRCHVPGGPRDFDPLPGRLVVFMSQEVEHEVLRSEGNRIALTLWIWDIKQDQHGR
eukprot:5075919-Prymnesium_polylepis.1